MLPRRFHIDGGVVIEDFFACQNRWFRDGLLATVPIQLVKFIALRNSSDDKRFWVPIIIHDGYRENS